MSKNLFLKSLLALSVLSIVMASSVSAQKLRIGVIEPYSGPVAAVGIEAVETIELAAERINARGGVQFEIIRMDNAMNAEKTTQQLKKAIDMGLRYVSQGVGSNHALNIIEFLEKHNKRNRKKPVVYFNTAAVTTDFTEDKCSFWHFRFDANVDMKVAGLATVMGQDPKVKKIYMVNQNYAYGQSFQGAARKLIKSRTKAQLVGDDLIVPFGKVLDFTPYVAKIKSSGADTVLTGNWGPDFMRLVKAIGEAGLDVQVYSIYAGIPSSVFGYGKENGVKTRIKQITEAHENDEDRADVKAIGEANMAKFKRSWYSDRYRFFLEMIALAAKKAGSDDPVKVAKALEGLDYQGPKGSTITMRKQDHQIIMPMVVSEIDPNAPIKMIYNDQPVGIAWKTVGWASKDDMTLKSVCKMKRPK